MKKRIVSIGILCLTFIVLLMPMQIERFYRQIQLGQQRFWDYGNSYQNAELTAAQVVQLYQNSERITDQEKNYATSEAKIREKIEYILLETDFSVTYHVLSISQDVQLVLHQDRPVAMDLVSVELETNVGFMYFVFEAKSCALLEMQCEFNQWFKVDERNLPHYFQDIMHLTEQMYTITCDEATNTLYATIANEYEKKNNDEITYFFKTNLAKLML